MGNGGVYYNYTRTSSSALGSSVGIWLFHEISSYSQNENRYKGFDQSCNIYLLYFGLKGRFLELEAFKRQRSSVAKNHSTIS